MIDGLQKISGHNPGPFTLTGTNCYIVGNGRERILIDTGAGESAFKEELKGFLDMNKCSIKNILITHWHNDHTGGINDVFAVCPNATIFKRKAGLEQDDLFKYEDIADNQVFNAEGVELVAVASPGHTNDSTAFFWKDKGILFTGDCILGNGSSVFTDLSSLMGTLHKLKSLNPTHLCCGHGDFVQDGVAKIQEYIDHRNARDQDILTVLSNSVSPRTIEEIVTLIYMDIKDERILKAAANSIKFHLEKLVKEGRVTSNDHGFSALVG